MNHADDITSSSSKPHITSRGTLLGTWLSLMALTGLTVAASQLNLAGGAEIAVALGIATLKASLVALLFMHLWHGQRFHFLVLLGAAVSVVLFVSITFIDASNYQPDIDAADKRDGLSAAPSQSARAVKP